MSRSTIRGLAVLMTMLVSSLATNTVISGDKPRLMEVTMADHEGHRSSVAFGASRDATDGFDFTLGEVPIPPAPPPGNFEIRLTDRPTHRRVPGDGSYVDIRPFRSPTQIDTFFVHYQADSRSFPVVFTWCRVTHCDSLILEYTTPDGRRRANMSDVRSLTVNDDSDTRLVILQYGATE